MGFQWSLEGEAEVLELLERGWSAVAVARRLGVSPGSVRQCVRRNFMTTAMGHRGGLGPPARIDPDPGLDRPVQGSHGHRMDLADRALIQNGLENQWSPARIAARLGVHRSTVTREIARNSDAQGRYRARVAQHRTEAARSRPRPTKLQAQPLLRAAVITRLNKRFSPRQTSQDLRKAFPEQHDMRVSHETVYQALYIQGKGALRHELKVDKALRSGRTSRVPKSKLPARTNRPWLQGHHISTRPPEAEDRAVPGHWEGDLIIGAHHKSALITLAERSSRFTLIRKAPLGRTSLNVVDELIAMIATLPAALRKSLTWDQGSEMAEHARLTLATDIQVYFCDPHSPWQRGTNENTNGLIRDFYPKTTDFRHISAADIENTQHLLNIRPRETLNWDTPAEHLDKFLKTVALTP